MCCLHCALIVKLTFFDALDEWFCFLEHIILLDCEVCTVVGCVFGEIFCEYVLVWCFMLDFYKRKMGLGKHFVILVFVLFFIHSDVGFLKFFLVKINVQVLTV